MKQPFGLMEWKRQIIARRQPPNSWAAVGEWAKSTLAILPKKPTALLSTGTDGKHSGIAGGIAKRKRKAGVARSCRTRSFATNGKYDRRTAALSTEPNGKLERIIEHRARRSFDVACTNDDISTIRRRSDDRQG
jgi:hypothetical protein